MSFIIRCKLFFLFIGREPTTWLPFTEDGIGASELQIQRSNRSPTLPRFNESIS